MNFSRLLMTGFVVVAASSALVVAAGESEQAEASAPTVRQYKPFKNLNEKEIEAFFKVYQEEAEPHTQGGFRRGWIVGEAPLKQPEHLAHFPVCGRLKVQGVLSKAQDKGLLFKTKLRSYRIVDRYIIYKLNQLGYNEQDGPRKVTLDAYWDNIERVSGYTLIFCNAIKLHPMETKTSKTFRSMFNGVSLQGWERGVFPEGHVYNGGDWTVESNAIVGRRLIDDRRGGWLWTDKDYANFELQLEVYPDWGCDTGILLRQNDEGGGIQITLDYRDGGNVGFIHGQGSGNYYTRPYSLQGISEDGVLKSLDIEKHYNAEQHDGLIHATTGADFLKAWKVDDFNHIRIRCTGKYPSITVWINGLKTCEMRSESFKASHPTKPEMLPYNKQSVYEILGSAGRIGLQIHPGNNWALPDGQVRFRNIRILPLP